MESGIAVVCRPLVERDYPHAVSIVGQRPLYARLPIRPGPHPPRGPIGEWSPPSPRGHYGPGRVAGKVAQTGRPPPSTGPYLGA